MDKANSSFVLETFESDAQVTNVQSSENALSLSKIQALCPGKPLVMEGTEENSLTHTTSTSWANADGTQNRSDDIRPKNSNFNLVRQLFSSTRDSVASDQDTAVGDHSKCSSICDADLNPAQPASDCAFREQRLSCAEIGCQRRPTIQHFSEGMKRALNPSQKSFKSEMNLEGTEPVSDDGRIDACDDAMLRDVAAFRSWPLELRSRAAEWRIDPTVSPAPPSLALPRALLLTRSPPPIPRTRRYCRQRSSGRETAASSTRRGGGASTRR